MRVTNTGRDNIKIQPWYSETTTYSSLLFSVANKHLFIFNFQWNLTEYKYVSIRVM
jgi:hypothetical protein